MKPENKAQLVDILTYHVLPAQVLAKDVKTLQAVATVEGKNVIVKKTGNVVTVGPSSKDQKTVTAADNLASNGVAHIIDGVMLPPATSPTVPNIVELAESVKDLSTLVSAVVAADLADTLSSPGPFTVFAPTNEAFAALPAGTLDDLLKPENKDQLVEILTYHVLPEEVLTTTLNHKTYNKKTVQGKTLKVQKTRKGQQDFLFVGSEDAKSENYIPVTAADNLASNGVAHIISGVIPLPADPLPNIVELAESVADLSTLVAAVVAGDLVDTLSSPGPFTVFAPTNEAFAALPAGTLDDLMKPENKGQLVDILTYHVLPVKAAVADLDLFQPSTTVEGKPLHITKWGSTVKVGSSLRSEDLRTVTGPDNMANNGVAHIIDGVLLPPTGAVVV
jgi:transforming growth factor-beta-induced protein